jgi:hypothetical protein
VATGGVGGGGGVGGAGAGGSGGMGGMAGRPGKTNGTSCAMGSECSSTYCADGVCCEAACAGTCTACVMTKTNQADGLCRPIPATKDPDNECPMQAASTCGATGTGCNGAGACTVYAANTPCGSTLMCSSDNSGVISGQVCNGAGKCNNAAATSCNGFLCSGSACLTTCTDDSTCAMSGFCSSSTCIATANLAGNGDVETGTLAGWLPANGGAALAVSSPSTTPAGYAHGGMYSVVEPTRSIYYQGPAFNLPTGLGAYNISFWAMQTDDMEFYGVTQIEMKCMNSQKLSYIQITSDFSIMMPKGVWTLFSGTVDTSMSPNTGKDCFAVNPPTGNPVGLVRSAVLYLNQPTTDPSQNGYFIPTPNEYPNLYMDDVVVTVTDGHNLIGNPNFEAGYPDGWTGTAGSPAPAVTTTFAHGGTSSLLQTGRTSPTGGIQYMLPTGAARYTVSAWVMQTGTKPHPLVLQPSYSCTGPTMTPMVAPPIVLSGDGNAVANNWVQLTGTVVMPPASAPAGCVLNQPMVTLQQAETGACSTVECPDLYIDDASLTVK